MDFIDETGSHWQWVYDSLGRLTETLEEGPVTKTLTLETDYTYDLLDDLLSVNQKGASGDTARYRTFTYDSLSRLTERVQSGNHQERGRLYADIGTMEHGLHLRCEWECEQADGCARDRHQLHLRCDEPGDGQELYQRSGEYARR